VSWLWERSTGQQVPIPEVFDVVVAPVELQVAVYEPAGRDGAWVDTRRARIPPRRVTIRGRLAFETVREALDSLAGYAWQWSGGPGKLYYGDVSRYLELVLVQYNTEPVLGLVWDIEALFVAPRPFWQNSFESSVSGYVTPSQLSSNLDLQVGGGWIVWPRVTVSAVGAAVTNPRVEHPSGRYLQYSGTLQAGETLVVDPDALTAKVGPTDVLGSINLSWFDPQAGRLYLAPDDTRLTISASAIGTGGRADFTISWRRLWL